MLPTRSTTYNFFAQRDVRDQGHVTLVVICLAVCIGSVPHTERRALESLKLAESLLSHV